jgi:hypothetical protein
MGEKNDVGEGHERDNRMEWGSSNHAMVAAIHQNRSHYPIRDLRDVSTDWTSVSEVAGNSKTTAIAQQGRGFTFGDEKRPSKERE